jgi:hypothetical protein
LRVEDVNDQSESVALVIVQIVLRAADIAYSPQMVSTFEQQECFSLAASGCSISGTGSQFKVAL